MADEETKVSAEVSGGTAQGVIGAGEVHVGRLVINNYALPNPAAEEAAPEKPGALPENPYKGLMHFGPNDADLFFGRQKAIDKLVQAVETRSFNAVLGPSGCGKSSVLLAGVAPTLHKTGQWAFAYFRISDSLEKDPFLALAQALLPLYQPDLDETDRLVQRRKLGAALEDGTIPVTDILDAIRRNRPEARVLLIADQFEELYTSNISADQQTHFMDLLIEAARVAEASSPPLFSLAVTLRADFLGLASMHRPFADAIDESVHILGPMKPDELSAAIVEPARLRGVAFEEGLVDTILADVGREPGNLPLLEFALTRMWDRQQDRRLSLASYDAVGRVTGALTQHADHIFEHLEAADQAAARRIFTQLVRLGAGTEDTRRVARRAELSDAIWPLVQRLAGPDCRLVVTNATADEGETAEVVHEALIKHWGTLRNWVKEDRVFLTWLDGFRVFLTQWSDHGGSEEDLLRGAALSQAEEWSAKRREALNDNEKAFIDASIDYRDRSAREEKERQERELKNAQELAARNNKVARWQRIVIMGSAVFAVVLLGLVWFVNEARIDAEEARGKALISASRSFSLIAKEALGKGKFVKAAKFALAAWPRDADSIIPPSEEVFKTLTSATLHLREPRSLNLEEWMACGPHGDDRVVMTQPEVTTVFDITTGKKIHLYGIYPTVPNLVVSRDGTWFATGSYNDVGRLVDAAGDRVTRLQVDRDESTTLVALSLDEKTLAVGEVLNGGIHLWDPAEHLKLKDFSAGNIQIGAMGLSPDGGQIVISSEGSGKIHLLDRLSEEEIWISEIPKSGWGERIARIGFTGDGRVIFSLDRGGVLVLWNAETGKEIGYSTADSEINVTTLAAAPNGTLIAIGYKSGAIALIDSASGQPSVEMSGHHSTITTIAYSADGRRLVSGGTDGTARLWNLETGAEIARFKLPGLGIECVTFLPDQRRVAVFFHSGPPVIWTIDQNSQVTWREKRLAIGTVSAFSEDGAYLVTGSHTTGITLFDTMDLSQVDALPYAGKPITSVAVSKDGSHIAIGILGAAEVWRRGSNGGYIRFDLESRYFDRESRYTVSALAFSHDNTQLTIAGAYLGTSYFGFDQWSVREWLGDIDSGSVVRTWEPLAPGASPTRQWPAVSQGKRLKATTGRGSLSLWDIATGAEIASLDHGDSQVPILAFRGDGSLLSMSPGGHLGTWDLSWIANGSFFQIVCGMLPGHNIGTPSREQKIPTDEPVCGEGYDPPLP